MSLARGFLTALSLPQALNVIINIHVILRRRNLFEMGAVRSDRESRSVALVWRLGEDVMRMSPDELYSRNLDFCGEDVSNSGENEVFRFVFEMRGLVSLIFLIHLVITQGDKSEKTRKLDQMSIKIESSRNITMQTHQL